MWQPSADHGPKHVPNGFNKEWREGQARKQKDASIVLRRDQSLCEKCLDWGGLITEVLTLALRISSTSRRFNLTVEVRKENRQKANRRQEGADAVDHVYPDLIGQSPQQRGTQPAQAEGEPEE